MKTEFDPILRWPEVKTLVGLSRPRVYELISAGRFPRSIKLTPGGRANGWLKSEIDTYLKARVAERDNKPARPHRG